MAMAMVIALTMSMALAMVTAMATVMTVAKAKVGQAWLASCMPVVRPKHGNAMPWLTAHARDMGRP